MGVKVEETKFLVDSGRTDGVIWSTYWHSDNEKKNYGYAKPVFC